MLTCMSLPCIVDCQKAIPALANLDARRPATLGLSISMLGVLGVLGTWCARRLVCSVLGRSGTQFCARPLGMLGAGSVPLLGVLCACRTRWSSAPAVRCHVFHRIQHSASSGNQPLRFSGTRQCWPWAAPVLGRFLVWPPWRVVMDSAQPLRRSVAIWCSSSAHRARSPCSSLCTAWRSTIFGAWNPRRSTSPTLCLLLLSLACLYAVVHAVVHADMRAVMHT